MRRGSARAAGRARPTPDALERAVGPAALRQPEAVSAEVVGPSLEQGDLGRPAESGADQRQVLGKELILQGARARRQQHPLSAEQRGHEICESLARAGPRLDRQDLAPGQRRGDPPGHVHLLAAHVEARQRALQRPSLPEDVLELQHDRVYDYGTKETLLSYFMRPQGACGYTGALLLR